MPTILHGMSVEGTVTEEHTVHTGSWPAWSSLFEKNDNKVRHKWDSDHLYIEKKL